MTGLHFAVLCEEGIVSMYYLKENDPHFDPNIQDDYGAAPLHYALMMIEDNNIESLLALGAKVN